MSRFLARAGGCTGPPEIVQEALADLKRQSCRRCGPAGDSYQRKGERGIYNPLWESTDCGKTKKQKTRERGQMIIKGKQQELIHPYSQWLEIRKETEHFGWGSRRSENNLI